MRNAKPGVSKDLFDSAELNPADVATPSIKETPVPIAKTTTGIQVAETQRPLNAVSNFLARHHLVEAERDHLKEQLAQIHGALLTKHFDPKTIQPSRWANRHESSFQALEFARLREDIAEAGGNVQPIKVRPTNNGTHEIVFGHRRHRACLELSLPVLAMVEDMDDIQLWEQMERENRSRADLSPYEQGLHYKLALDSGLYRSMRCMAKAVGVDVGNVSKMLVIANLPPQVINAFAKPGDIQVNWATVLTVALDRDPMGLRNRADDISVSRKAGLLVGQNGRSREILEVLIGPVVPYNTPPRKIDLMSTEGCKVASIKTVKGGKWIIEILEPGLKSEAIEAAIRRLLRL